mmetsp:Transcript_20545/g.63914  ORF Transcript_20545/g.63914 Transcript_20545/m.63914 type:complete len:216 (-) Transcript_20545:92-739(-)
MVCSSLGARLVVVVAGRVLEEIVLEDGLAALVALGAVLALVLGEALALVELEPRRGRQLDEAARDRLLALAARHLGRLGREVRVLARRVQRAAVGRLEVVLLFDALAAEGARDDLAELLPHLLARGRRRRLRTLRHEGLEARLVDARAVALEEGAVRDGLLAVGAVARLLGVGRLGVGGLPRVEAHLVDADAVALEVVVVGDVLLAVVARRHRGW